MSKFMRKTVVAAKIEVTPGTDITPGAADCVLVRNASITPLDVSYEERNIIRGFFGNFDAIVTMKKVKIAFEVEYAGSGTAGTAPAWDALMQACGMSSTVSAGVSVTYAPVSGTGKTLSIYYQIDGLNHKALYCRGTVKLNIKANGIPYFAFEFIGLDGGRVDAANLVPSSFGTYKTPVAANKANTPTATLFSTAVALETLTLDIGNTNEQVSRIGSEQVLHTDRKVVGTVQIEMTSIAAKDWLTAVATNALGNLVVAHGVGAGNVMTLTCNNVELQQPQYSDQQGIQMVQFNIRANPTTAGNDEFSVANT